MTSDELLAIFHRICRHRAGVPDPELEHQIAEGRRRELERFEKWVASGTCPLDADAIEGVRASHREETR